MDTYSMIRRYERASYLSISFYTYMTGDRKVREFIEKNLFPAMVELLRSAQKDTPVSQKFPGTYKISLEGSNEDIGFLLAESVQSARRSLIQSLDSIFEFEKEQVHEAGFRLGDAFLTGPAIRAICNESTANRLTCYRTYAQKEHALVRGGVAKDGSLIESLEASIRQSSVEGDEFIVYREGVVFDDQHLKDIAIESINSRNFPCQTAISLYNTFKVYRKKDQKLSTALLEAVTRTEIPEREYTTAADVHKARLNRLYEALESSKTPQLKHHCADKLANEIQGWKEHASAYAFSLWHHDLYLLQDLLGSPTQDQN